MTELRDKFRQLIKLEELKEQLEEKSPNAFEKISLLSYPESWETEPDRKEPTTLEGMEPFCLGFTEFDMKFKGKYDFFVKENTEPLREEELDREGYRDLYGPPQLPEDYPHIKALHCKRAQPTRLPRNFKQRLPFPQRQTPEVPTLQVEAWMLEPFPPKIDWENQEYKGLPNSGLRPSYIRWEEYPEYEVRDVDKQHQMETPTLAEMALPYATGKKKGLCRIEEEKPDMTPEQVEDFFEERDKNREFGKLLLGHQPLHWWEERQDQQFRDFQDFEIVGVKNEEEARRLMKVEGDCNMREEVEERLNWNKAMGRGRGEWDDEKEQYSNEWKPLGGQGKMRITSTKDSSWAGKGLGASGWNRQKMAMPRKPWREPAPQQQPDA